MSTANLTFQDLYTGGANANTWFSQQADVLANLNWTQDMTVTWWIDVNNVVGGNVTIITGN